MRRRLSTILVKMMKKTRTVTQNLASLPVIRIGGGGGGGQLEPRRRVISQDDCRKRVGVQTAS